MARLRICLLGPARVELDGEPVQIDRRKAVALLAYLAVTGVQHRRDSLATLLWPELDQSTARARLRRVLVTLRRGLGEGWLDADRETIGLQPDAGLWLDVDQFRKRLAACENHGHSAREVCPDCEELLEEAARLYGGAFLAGFTLRDSPGFDEWQFFETEGLRDKLGSVLERLALWHGSRGACEAAIGHARRWVGLDPLHEPAQRVLMELYAGAGQRAAALRQYEECARVLKSELGLPPAQETTALYEQIRAGPAERLEPTGLPPRPRHNLPAQPIPFVGRQRELAEISECLADPNCRLLTLVGAGGSGKTRLAIAAAAPQVDDYEHGVFFVSLAPLQSSESIVPTVAQALGFSFYGRHDPEEQMLAYLARRRMLLLLDNFEHLLARADGDEEDGSRLVSAIVEAAPGVKVLVTSRAALRVQHEQRYPVTGLAYPGYEIGWLAKDLPSDAADYSAVRLFVQGARQVAPEFRLERDNLPDVIRVCRLVAGMPLSILLAASWVCVLTPAEIAAQLEEGLDLLETDLRDVPARQRSMRAVFDHSWSLLTAREQEVMEALSVFRGGFTRRAARHVAAASARDLKSLIGGSLVQSSRGPTTAPGTGLRFELHELLRQYAAEQLGELPAVSQAVHDRHCDYYTAALEAYGEELKGPRQRDALLEMDREIDNARAAWDWAAERCHSEHLSQAAFGLSQYYRRKARAREAEAAFRAAVEGLRSAGAAEAGPNPAELRALAKTLSFLASFTSYLGRREAARELLEESLDLLGGPELADEDTRLDESYAWLALGEVQRATGRGGFRRSWERSLALARSTGDQWVVAAGLRQLGKCDDYDGELRAARRAGEESSTIYRALGDVRGIGTTAHWLGWVCARQGELERGEELARESIRVLEELGDPVALAPARQNLAAAITFAGRYAESHALHEESLAALVDLGILSAQPAVLGSLPWIELMMGEYQKAREHLETGLRLAREADYLFVAANCWAHMAVLAILDGEYAEARRLLCESIEGFERIACQELAVLGRCWIACPLRGLGETDAAQKNVVEVLRWAAEHDSVMVRANVLHAGAMLLLDQGEAERAVEILELARTFPYLAKSQWHEDLVGRPICEAAASLPPEVVAAARERGRVRDVGATLHELAMEFAA